jgi:hypothetical protein
MTAKLIHEQSARKKIDECDPANYSLVKTGCQSEKL